MKYTVCHWLDGKTEKMYGETISEAFKNSGYGGSSILNLVDYFENIQEEVELPLINQIENRIKEVLTEGNFNIPEQRISDFDWIARNIEINNRENPKLSLLSLLIKSWNKEKTKNIDESKIS